MNGLAEATQEGGVSLHTILEAATYADCGSINDVPGPEIS